MSEICNPHGRKRCIECEYVRELEQDIKHCKAITELKNAEIEKLRNYLETLRSNTPYGMYQQQITEVLQDAEEWPCTCGNCDGEHFGMAINRRLQNEQNK